MADRAAVLADLAAEGDALDAVVAHLEDTAWRTPTPAEGWTVADSISHLEWTDRQTLRALTDPDGFAAAVAAFADRVDTIVDDEARAGAATEPAGLLHRWRTGRTAVSEALAAVRDDERIPWFGPPMKASSMATARLMETWAHGIDVTDALGLPPTASDRLRHVAHLGVRTRDFAFLQRGQTPPAEPFRVELTSPGGDVWSWGPEDAAQRVTGPALDFCLRVTRRRHRADLALAATGAEADRWLDLAQAFAGPPGAEREPREGA
ncbi:TIGR03084 family metal-binding protein [Blastococcus sp. PRF04-17]|uniref:TIGR03084 family metal-binding protein n=1 Tax=Blastococcus sp. PRF04-17 TaxID=2933797 RepID=UPI001FF40DD4|nr:TIGR03084 family metal-binding protein [Blastococcus sp. PRF04-17]UOY00777.1 TIGR03084 family metal-binding protein [Blastococcus sp. PRF04-17]